MTTKREYDRRNTTKEQLKSIRAHSRAMEALDRLYKDLDDLDDSDDSNGSTND